MGGQTAVPSYQWPLGRSKPKPSRPREKEGCGLPLLATRKSPVETATRLRSSVGIDPVHRTRFAVLRRAAELEKTQTPQAATEADLRTADDFSAAETKTALMRAVPG